MRARSASFSVVLCAVLLGTGPALFGAQEETLGDYAAGMGAKIGRGLVNVLSSPLEIPCTMSSDIRDRGASGTFTGFGKGTAFMLRRLLVGVTEVGTFLIPMEATIPPVCQKPAPAAIGASQLAP